MGGLDRSVDIVRARLGHHRPVLTGCGIDAGERGRSVLELPVDVLLEPAHQANAGMTSSMRRRSDSRLRSKLIPVSIHIEYSS